VNIFALIFVVGVLVAFAAAGLKLRAAPTGRIASISRTAFIVAVATCAIVILINRVFYEGQVWDLRPGHRAAAPAGGPGPPAKIGIHASSLLIVVGLALAVAGRGVQARLSRRPPAGELYASDKAHRALRLIGRTLSWLSLFAFVAAVVDIFMAKQ